MRRLFAFTLAVAVVAASDTCPASNPFGEWAQWTEECLWFPLEDIREAMVNNCDIVINNLDELPKMPEVPGMPGKCGHCSFKARCAKRQKIDGCFPLDVEKQVCHEHADICEMPRFPKYNLGCKYDFANEYLKQCWARADYPEWKREGMLKMVGMMPEFHCIEKDDKCMCCCHPYMPNAEGTACVEHNEPECENWGEWNDWSEQCVWLPPSEMRQAYATHCDFEVPVSDKAKAAYEAFEKMLDPVPPRCGYCSYKIKCRKRSKLDSEGKKTCFPLQVQKRSCGPDDGEGFGDVCDIPKFRGSCNFTEGLHKLAGSHKISSGVKKLPMSMRMGLMKMVSLMPHGDCRENGSEAFCFRHKCRCGFYISPNALNAHICRDGDRCKCCCHPYKLSEDGQSCELKHICNDADDLNVEWDMNIPDDSSSFFWFL